LVVSELWAVFFFDSLTTAALAKTLNATYATKLLDILS
jgi:hypothetical protein